jgi:hypothetical protein
MMNVMCGTNVAIHVSPFQGLSLGGRGTQGCASLAQGCLVWAFQALFGSGFSRRSFLDSIGLRDPALS